MIARSTEDVSIGMLFFVSECDEKGVPIVVGFDHPGACGGYEFEFLDRSTEMIITNVAKTPFATWIEIAIRERDPRSCLIKKKHVMISNTMLEMGTISIVSRV